LRMEKLP